MVFVINQRNQPLMPTTPRKAKKLLKECKAKVVKLSPFSIQLLYATGENKQDITLGVDAGSKTIGISATTQKNELLSMEVKLRTDIPKLLKERREFRHSRRSRKTRYRKARFLNRTKSKHKGWIAPSVDNKIQTHLRIVENAYKILPITKVIVECASFDIQKIKNPEIKSKEYQQGDQLGFWNVREYVLFRDNHKCQNPNCKNKNKDKILEVHHLLYKSEGGTDKPSNSITLCNKCHTSKNHKANNFLWKWCQEGKKAPSFKDAAFMGIMRWAFYNKLKILYKNVGMTYGYITKNTRIQQKLPKQHCVDAFCISENINAKLSNISYLVKQVRNHNRQIHKAKTLKNGIRKANQAKYTVNGFRLFDKVSYNKEICFIFGRRTSGYFNIRKLDGTVIHKSANFKKIKLIEKSKTLLWERRKSREASQESASSHG